MNFEQALIYELSSIPGFRNRVYPLSAPEANAKQGVPYCIIISNDGIRTKTLDGYQTGKSVSGEVNVISANYGELKGLTEQVINRLISTEQRVIGIEGPYIDEFTYQEPEELYEDKPALYRCLIDFKVHF